MEEGHEEALKVWKSLGQSLLYADPPFGTVGHLHPGRQDVVEQEADEEPRAPVVEENPPQVIDVKPPFSVLLGNFDACFALGALLLVLGINPDESSFKSSS